MKRSFCLLLLVNLVACRSLSGTDKYFADKNNPNEFRLQINTAVGAVYNCRLPLFSTS